MKALRTLLRLISCRYGWCYGHVVSGTHDGVVWIGWQCDECHAVRDYEPTKLRRR